MLVMTSNAHYVTLLHIAAVFIAPIGSLNAQEDARTLVMVEKGLDSVGFYTARGRRLAGAPVGHIPHEMVFSPDRKLAFVSDNGSFRYTDDVDGGNTVTVVDLTTRKRRSVIHLGSFRRPHGLSLDAETGLLAVTVENPDLLLLVDSAKGTIVRAYDVKGTTPHMVTLAPGAKWAYVMNAESGNVSAVDLTTGDVTLIETGQNPQGSVISEDGKELYVTCEQHIAVVDLDSLKVVARFGNGANRIVLTRDGTLLVYSSLLPGVGFADRESRQVLDHIDLPYRPFSINLSHDEQYVYLAAEEQGVVYVVSIDDRKIVRQFDTPSGTRPDPVMDLVQSN